MRKFFFLALLVCSLPVFSTEEGPSQESPERVAKIQVTGLKRTRQPVVDDLLRGYLGEQFSQDLSRRIVATLLDTGIFENIQVRRVGEVPDGAVLEVSLVEKWTILPLPMFSSDSEGITAGIALIDMNAFGMNDKLFASALIMPGGWTGSVAYIDASKSPADPKKSLSVAYLKNRTVQTDLEDQRVRRFDATFAEIGTGVSLPLMGGPVSAELGLAFRDRAVDADSRDSENRVYSSRVLAGRAGVSYRASAWDGTFLSQSSVDLQGSYAYGLLGDSFYTLRARAVMERPLGAGFRLVAQSSAFYAPDAPATFEEGRASASVAILPKQFSSTALVGGTLGFEARLAAFSFGTLSALANYQGAVVAEADGAAAFAHGPAAGIRLYLAKVAVPAMDLSAAYNLPTGLFQVVFGIGMRF